MTDSTIIKEIESLKDRISRVEEKWVDYEKRMENARQTLEQLEQRYERLENDGK